MERQTTIDGYTVDLDTDVGGSSLTGCWVSRKYSWGATYAASLEVLMAAGCLTMASGSVPVPQQTIDKIEKWALENGY